MDFIFITIILCIARLLNSSYVFSLKIQQTSSQKVKCIKKLQLDIFTLDLVRFHAKKKNETWIKVGTCFYSYCNETKALIHKKLRRYKKILRFNYGLIMCLIWKISWTLNISWVLSLEFLKNVLNIPQKSVYRKRTHQ